MNDLFGEITRLFARRGGDEYFGEAVSQLEHALQSADLAVRDGADDALVAAALLHDVGHLLDDDATDPETMGVDARHEAIGAAWLARHFPPAVCAPVGLHVPAKRYLCAVEPAYLAALSPASSMSLRLQGGPMSAEEVAAFEARAYFADAVRLRRWDDGAKIVGREVPGLEAYAGRLSRLARRD